MKTTWERGRPARTSLAQLRLSPPRRSTVNGTAPGSICKGCSRFAPHCHSPLEGKSDVVRRRRPGSAGVPPAQSLAQLRLSPPRRSTANGAVSGSLCKGCSRFTPSNHSPLEGKSDVVRRRRPGSAGVPPAPAWHSYVYLLHVDQPRTAPLPDHCVKDVPGLYPLITPPLRGSRRSRAARRRLMRWGGKPGRQRGAATPDRFSTVLIY